MRELVPMFGDAVGPWHRWFAWKPVVSYDNRSIWLRFCWRRCIQRHYYLSYGPDFWFQYAVDVLELPSYQPPA